MKKWMKRCHSSFLQKEKNYYIFHRANDGRARCMSSYKQFVFARDAKREYTLCVIGQPIQYDAPF